MSTTGRIMRHIAKLPKDQLFTTRELLVYGPRAYIDQLTSRLVKTEEIRRVARGVFCRSQDAIFTAYQIAAVKARAFGRNIFCEPDNQKTDNRNLDISETEAVIESDNRETNSKEVHFYIDGRTSSFWSVVGRIRLKTLNGRLRALGHTLAGRTLRALWQLKSQLCNNHIVQQARLNFRRTDKQETIRLLIWLPQWLHEYFCPPVEKALTKIAIYKAGGCG